MQNFSARELKNPPLLNPGSAIDGRSSPLVLQVGTGIRRFTVVRQETRLQKKKRPAVIIASYPGEKI